MDIKYYDIGVNLFSKQFPDPAAVIKQAAENGVKCIITGTGMRENIKIDAFVKKNDAYGTVGIHPHNADSAIAEDYRLIEKLARDNERIVAIGECGLDYDRMFSRKQNQLRCFERLVEVAEENDMPLFLHEREAFDDFVNVLLKHPSVCQKSVVHCYTGGKEHLETYLAMGCSIGITGWICDGRRGAELRKVVKSIPVDKIMVETDSPWLTPKGQGLDHVNVPWNIKYVVKQLADSMGITENSLIMHAQQNTKSFFDLI